MKEKPNWRQLYIKILESGPDRSEYEYAAELIEAGYARGHILPNYQGIGGKILSLEWLGPTTHGREYADSLRDQLARQTWSHRTRLFGVWLVGVGTPVALQWLANL